MAFGRLSFSSKVFRDLFWLCSKAMCTYLFDNVAALKSDHLFTWQYVKTFCEHFMSTQHFTDLHIARQSTLPLHYWFNGVFVSRLHNFHFEKPIVTKRVKMHQTSMKPGHKWWSLLCYFVSQNIFSKRFWVYLNMVTGKWDISSTWGGSDGW